MFKKNLYTGILILLLSMCTMTDILAAERQAGKITTRHNTTANNQAQTSTGTKATPGDTTQFSIQVEGQSNTIKINGKEMRSTADTTVKQNNIRVSGEGNTVTINQTDRKSEVVITQKGKNNHIQITQKK